MSLVALLLAHANVDVAALLASAKGRAQLRARFALTRAADPFLVAAVDPEPWLALSKLPGRVLDRELGLLSVLLDRAAPDRAEGHLPVRLPPVLRGLMRPIAAFAVRADAKAVQLFAAAAKRRFALPPELVAVVARFVFSAGRSRQGGRRHG
jgi:hypothetical protein